MMFSVNMYNNVVDIYVGRNIVSDEDILFNISIFAGDFVSGEDIRWKN